ncbi:serine/threonine protein kinase [Brevibacillus dissolubilis]|uniref:serine/threonine protein kinase n=1 Tax=Brevibacillus dissolubilis TaxID=1844116 RepID=UPI001115E3B6|nr:serine/threonine-protein kinase [Brevibacillus dissolubilis]
MNGVGLCMGCMREWQGSGACVTCGFNERKYPASPLYLPLRTVLAERYLLGKVLGQGGFGITYLGLDVRQRQCVKLAIKEFLPLDVASRVPNSQSVTPHTENYREYFQYGLGRFMDEVRALQRFNRHPGIVSVVDAFYENGTAYMAMQYLEGETFKQYLERKGGRITVDTALRIMLPVADALRAVNELGMLHRDISPDNIYLTNSQQVKILDFGAARYAFKDRSKSMSIIYKPGYAPEEQYRSKGNHGPWTDVYAVCATFYRAISGQPPPESLNRLESDTLIPPSRLGVMIPPAVESALLRGLAVKAKDRLQNMDELKAALLAGPITYGDRTPSRKGDRVQEAWKIGENRAGQVQQTPYVHHIHQVPRVHQAHQANQSPESHQSDNQSNPFPPKHHLRPIICRNCQTSNQLHTASVQPQPQSSPRCQQCGHLLVKPQTPAWVWVLLGTIAFFYLLSLIGSSDY